MAPKAKAHALGKTHPKGKAKAKVKAKAEINRHHNTVGLCNSLLSRLAEVKRLDGDRLRH